MFYQVEYYIYDESTAKAIAGPMILREAVNLIGNNPKLFTMSRSALAKNGFYEKTKSGDEKLKQDILDSEPAR